MNGKGVNIMELCFANRSKDKSLEFIITETNKVNALIEIS